LLLLLYRTSIYAQKIVDGFTAPEVTVFHPLTEFRIVERPMYGVAHPDVKATDGGTRSTYMAAKHYAEENKARRDELLQKYAAEGESGGGESSE